MFSLESNRAELNIRIMMAQERTAIAPQSSLNTSRSRRYAAVRDSESPSVTSLRSASPMKNTACQERPATAAGVGKHWGQYTKTPDALR